VADRQSNFDLATGKQLFAGQDGNSRSLFNAYHKQFMPRIGIAWVPEMSKAAGGARRVRDHQSLRAPRLTCAFRSTRPSSSNRITYDLTRPGDIRTGFVDVRPGLTPSGQVRAWDPNLRPSSRNSGTSPGAAVHQQLPATAAYVGQKATHLVVPREGNQPPPGTGP
jgi:hypothetical protein